MELTTKKLDSTRHANRVALLIDRSLSEDRFHNIQNKDDFLQYLKMSGFQPLNRTNVTL